MHTRKYLKNTAAPIKTLCILLVVMFLAGIAQLIVVQVYYEFSRQHTMPANPVVEQTEQETTQWDINNSAKAFASDGTVYLVNNVGSPGTKRTKYVVKDQDNKVLFEGKEEDNPYSFIQWAPKRKSGYGYHNNIHQQDLNKLNLIGGGFSRHFVIPMVNMDNKRTGHWFFDIDKRIFKYYSVTGEQLGYLGTNGYTENKTDALAFGECHRMINWLRPDSYNPIITYQALCAVYEIDFANKEVKALAKTDNDPIRYINLNNWQETEVYDYRPSLTVITNSNKCYLHLKKTEQSIEIQLSDDFPNHAMPIFAADKNTIFAKYQEILGYPKTNDIDVISAWWLENQYKARDYRVRLFEVDSAGDFIEKSSFTWTQPVRQSNVVYFSTREFVFSAVNSLSSPVPMLATLHCLKTGNYRQGPVWCHATMGFTRAYSSELKLPINLCVMTIFAVLAFLHAWPRRTHIAKLIFWIVFVFLFNLPGLLTYLALNHTPVIHCANCGKKRGLLQDNCCRCGNALPLPKSKETDLVLCKKSSDSKIE